MAFKLGKEQRGFKNPKDNQIFRKKLGDGILGEANSDGSIYIDKSVPDNMVDYIISNFDLAEIDFIVEVLDNNDVVRVREGLSDHIQAYVDSVTMERDLGAIH